MYNFFFTNNNQILSKYFTLRNEIYHNEFNDNIQIDGYDIKSHHLIITDQQENIIGGARITPRNPGSLPLEDHGILFSNHTQRTDVCEIGRVVVSKEHRSLDVLTRIFEEIKHKCREINLKTLLVIGKPKTVRLDSIMCNKINVLPQIIKEVSMSNSFYNDLLGEVNLLVITIPD